MWNRRSKRSKHVSLNQTNTCPWIYIWYNIYISYCRYNWPMFATHKLFGAVIFLRWWLNINHRTRPTCSHSNDLERVVSKSQVLYVWMECIINTWLHPTIAKSLPGRMCIQSLTPVWKSEVYLNQLVDVHFKNDDQLGFWSDECSHFNV